MKRFGEQLNCAKIITLYFRKEMFDDLAPLQVLHADDVTEQWANIGILEKVSMVF